MINSMDKIDCDHTASYHASLSYENVAAAGLPARPLEFPTPWVHRGSRSTEIALDHRNGKIYSVSNVLMRSEQYPATGVQRCQPDRAYLIKKKIGTSTYGVTRLCVVLRRREVRVSLSDPKPPARQRRESARLKDEDAHWESTDELVVAKISSWAKIRSLRGRHLDDPIREISAMQLIGNYHPHVRGCDDVLQDDDFLYTIMPYCGGGDLLGRVIQAKATPVADKSAAHFQGSVFDETQERIWFRQLLSGLFHFQQKGVCHRDLTMENLILNDNNQLQIIDPGMALRVPYNDLSNTNKHKVTDVSEGSDRRLIQSQGQGGSLHYLAPEIVARDDAFDGFSVDLWASGVILFVMLVGVTPFSTAHPCDKRFAMIAKGNLKEMIFNLNIPMSEEACDLLQNMFWREPVKRLSLAQVMQHPWVLGKQFSTSESSTQSTSSQSSKGSLECNEEKSLVKKRYYSIWHRNTQLSLMKSHK